MSCRFFLFAKVDVFPRRPCIRFTAACNRITPLHEPPLPAGGSSCPHLPERERPENGRSARFRRLRKARFPNRRPLAATARPLVSTARPLAVTARPVAVTARPVVSTARPLATTARPVVFSPRPSRQAGREIHLLFRQQNIKSGCSPTQEKQPPQWSGP